MRPCCTRPPVLYLCITLWLLTIINCIYIFGQVLVPQCLSGSPLPSSQVYPKVQLIEKSEHTILSRIRFPSREKALLYGKPHGLHSKGKEFVLGIPSVARPHQDYLNSTIHSIISNLSTKELALITIIVFLTDRDKDFRLERGSRIYNALRKHVDSGLIRIIHASDNIYPHLNYSRIPRTFKDSPGQIEWRSKICLDFSFLMSYSSDMGGIPYFIHLEDDILPIRGFINATQEFLSTKKNNEWTSLRLSDYTSIGRLYRTSQLSKLVDFILIFYTKMPVDWLMAEFDRLQIPDQIANHKINKTLFVHGGHVSSKETYLRREQMDANKKYDEFKSKNPTNVTLLTNMKHYGYFTLNNSYFPSSLYFWCIPFPGGSIDLVLQDPSEVSSIQIISGFEKSEGHLEGSDGIKDASLQVSPNLKELHPLGGYADCAPFQEVARIKSNNFQVDSLSKKGQRIKCIRIQMGDSQTPYSSWLVVKLIRVIVST